MLALFKDSVSETSPMSSGLDWLRQQWRKALDKGHVPTLNFLEGEWLKEYPNHELPPDAEEWCRHMADHQWLRSLVTADVREIFAHGPQLIEAIGNERNSASFPLPAEDWLLWVETLAMQMRAEFNFSRPCSSTHWTYLDVPWRVTLVHPVLSPGSPAKVFLRKLAATAYPLDSYQVDQRGQELLRSIITNRDNILVAGSTGSGKTSLLSSLLGECHSEDHLVLLEDIQELSYQGPRLTRLLANEHRSLSDLLAHTLRLSPDRIVLGEMRSHEVVPFLLAMNTGHKGVMATLHASSAVDALHRVGQLFTLASNRKEMDYREVLKLVCRNVNVVVFVEERQVKQIIRVYGNEEGHPLFDILWQLS